jgi:hypothetical protein
MHPSQVLANSLLLGWLQNVRCLSGEGKHGIVLSHEQGEGSRDFPYAEKRWSCWRLGLLRRWGSSENIQSYAEPMFNHKGQHNDARMNIALVMTAVKLGATVANKVEVTQLLKTADGMIEGARVRDNLTGNEWDIKARVPISCFGWIDSILNAYSADRV